MVKKSNSFLYITISLALIIIAIPVTSFIQKQTQQTTETRARASATSALVIEGVVVSTDDLEYTITVNNVAFKDDYGANLGQWIVTPPSGFSLSQARAGSNVEMKIRAETMLAATKTMTATEIKIK